MTPEIGIAAVAAYLPENRVDTLARRGDFGFEEAFIRDKVGFTALARKAEGQETSDLAVAAVEALRQSSAIDLATLDVLVLVTQNPDGFGLPHTSAIVHGKLGLPRSCFCFDVSLGCSGFVAGLAILKGYMAAIGARNGLLVTADPYSKVVDPADRNTALIFGDGATATWLTADQPLYAIGATDQGTDGKTCAALTVQPDRKLFMNGRAVFDFCALNVGNSLKKVMAANGVTPAEIDVVLLHQGSKYIVDTIAQRSGLKAEFAAAGYGNLVSSSVPVLLVDSIRKSHKTILISGFGVGLGWATTVWKRL